MASISNKNDLIIVGFDNGDIIVVLDRTNVCKDKNITNMKQLLKSNVLQEYKNPIIKNNDNLTEKEAGEIASLLNQTAPVILD